MKIAAEKSPGAWPAGHLIIALLALPLCWAATAPTQAAEAGVVRCAITENGAPATGTITLTQGDKRIASGACRTGLKAAPGKYTAVTRLDRALDHPTRSEPIVVAADRPVEIKANFKTATLQLQIQTKGRGGAAIVTVLRDGKKIGTLGVGVTAPISEGDYQVIVQYGGQEQRFDKVQLRAGQHRILRARF